MLLFNFIRFSREPEDLLFAQFYHLNLSQIVLKILAIGIIFGQFLFLIAFREGPQLIFVILLDNLNFSFKNKIKLPADVFLRIYIFVVFVISNVKKGDVLFNFRY